MQKHAEHVAGYRFVLSIPQSELGKKGENIYMPIWVDSLINSDPQSKPQKNEFRSLGGRRNSLHIWHRKCQGGKGVRGDQVSRNSRRPKHMTWPQKMWGMRGKFT